MSDIKKHTFATYDNGLMAMQTGNLVIANHKLYFFRITNEIDFSSVEASTLDNHRPLIVLEPRMIKDVTQDKHFNDIETILVHSITGDNYKFVVDNAQTWIEAIKSI